MDIRVSPKHGLNPSISVCVICGEDKNELIVPGRLKGDAEAPRRAVWNYEPCDTCKRHMELGVIVVCVNEKLTTDKNNPYRDGRIVVVKDEAIKKVISPEMAENILKSRFCFMPDTVWDALGLPAKTEEPKDVENVK